MNDEKRGSYSLWKEKRRQEWTKRNSVNRCRDWRNEQITAIIIFHSAVVLYAWASDVIHLRCATAIQWRPVLVPVISFDLETPFCALFTCSPVPRSPPPGTGYVIRVMRSFVTLVTRTKTSQPPSQSPPRLMYINRKSPHDGRALSVEHSDIVIPVAYVLIGTYM